MKSKLFGLQISVKILNLNWSCKGLLLIFWKRPAGKNEIHCFQPVKPGHEPHKGIGQIAEF